MKQQERDILNFCEVMRTTPELALSKLSEHTNKRNFSLASFDVLQSTYILISYKNNMKYKITKQTKLGGTTAHKRPRPTVPISAFVTLEAEVHEQMFCSGSQSDMKPPVFNSQANLALIYRPCLPRVLNLRSVVWKHDTLPLGFHKMTMYV
ncbi:hypothetical protein TNCV_2988481 [Trichonephila clavipes]|nr:hypothetical protein TNCV_2988481 [Trichonephila clavipes]